MSVTSNLIYFWGKVWEPTIKVEYCKMLHSGKLQPCLQNTRLGQKWLAEANNLAYYEMTKVTVVKSFIVQAPGSFTIKHVMSVIISVS